jgi:hypothetical protein
MSADTTKLDMMKQVAADHLNSIPSAKSDEPRAFIEAAVNWFGQWWKTRFSWDTIAPGYCALVLNHEFAAAGVPAGFSEKQLFRDAPDPNLGGHIHISDYSLSRVFRDQGGHMDADSICRKLKALNLAAAPSVLFAPQTGVMIAAEGGVSGPVVPCHLMAFDGSLTVPNLDSLMTGLYNTELKYPETIPHIWRKKEKFIPIFQAEKLFQGLLYIHLKGNTQGTCIVVREDQTNAGRTDLTLTSLSPLTTFVLEMKVLKSFFYHPLGKPVKKFSKKENEVWADSGINQVCDYRIAKQAKEAFLLLYDMRKKHAPLIKVSARCAAKSVNFRKYDIFNATARDVRAAKPKRSKTR